STRAVATSITPTRRRCGATTSVRLMRLPSIAVKPDASTGSSTSDLLQNLTRSLVRQHLPLDPLERVVDRLRVAAELLGHLLVGRALEVQTQRVGLELRQPAAEREDEALQLLRRDHDDRGLVDDRAREGVAEGALAVRV